MMVSSCPSFQNSISPQPGLVLNRIFSIWGKQERNGDFHQWVPKTGWFIRENATKMDDLGGTPILGNLQMGHQKIPVCSPMLGRWPGLCVAAGQPLRLSLRQLLFSVRFAEGSWPGVAFLYGRFCHLSVLELS